MLKLPHQLCLLMATFGKEFDDEEQNKLKSPFCACTQTHIEMLLFLNISVSLLLFWCFNDYCSNSNNLYVLGTFKRNEIAVAYLMRVRLYLTFPCLYAQHICSGLCRACTQIFVEILCQVNFTSRNCLSDISEVDCSLVIRNRNK